MTDFDSLKYIRVVVSTKNGVYFQHTDDIESIFINNRVVHYGDVDFDGELTINDASLIQKYLVGLYDKLPVR